MNRLTGKRLKPFGPLDAPCAWIGEAPGEEEAAAGEPFIGPAGQLQNRVWVKHGIQRTKQLIHNVFDQRPPRNYIGYFYEDSKLSGGRGRTKLTWEGKEHVERLRRWLESLKRQANGGPNLLVAVGRQAMFHLTGKKRIYIWRGSVLPCTLVPGYKVYPILHPSHIMRTMNEEKVKLQGMKKERAQNALPLYEIDMDRIQVQVQFRDIRWPKRKFDINLTYWEIVAKLKKLIEDPKISMVTVDIEALWSDQGWLVWCIGFSWSPEYAFTIPIIRKDTRSFAWSLDEEAEIWRLVSLLFLHPKKLKTFQGGMYDLAILGRYYGLRVAKGTYGDTMFCHHASYPYLWKRLETLCSIYTWEPYYKDEGRVNILSRTDESEYKYNCKDCAVENEIYPVTVQNAKALQTYGGYKRTMSILPSHLGMTLRGVRIDKERMKRLSKDFKIEADKYERFIFDKTYELNLNSYTQLNKMLYGYLGLDVQTKRGTGKATSDKNALNKLKRLYHKTENGEIINAILEYKKFAKLSSTYLEMKLDSDGRIRTAYSLVSTWRMNSSKSPFGGEAKENKEGGNLQNIPKRTKEGKMIRKLFIPDPGMVLLCSDRVQAEAQYVAWDSRDMKRMKMYLDGWDVHWYNAKLIFGIPMNMEYNPKAKWKDAITNEEHYLEEYRHIGKTIVHAGNYGMGPFKLQEILALQGFIFTIAECKLFISTHKGRNPLLLQWQAEIREEVRSTRTLISPIGRKRQFLGRFDANLYNAAYAFKPQNFVSELTEITIQRIWERLGAIYQILMNVHDEVIGQCKPKDTAEAVKLIEMLSHYPVEIRGNILDIPVDFKSGDNWADAQPLKLAA